MYHGDYKYPNLSEAEKKAILVIANSLYTNVKTEIKKSLSMYEQLQQAFLDQIGPEE